ncbi:LexA family protein [Nocardioides mesophilus]|uniref:Helix-turn-helix domain-containing protein n=1 Tax=Nocardioides mesophilus TaxID=433659 RepID=A0A7G9RC56_9ACTN|nr:helix-turn-helix domain-containing protein [Nocardioides mesophilus]QNN53181.1 helix-turn-helix domain-containing protein [Nocardioides mesophilus]
MADNNWVQQREKTAALDALCEAIERYTAEHGYSPTRGELAEATGLGESTVRRHLKSLIAEGRVTEGSGPRTLRLAL